MTRNHWAKHIEPYLQPATDPVLAECGVMQPKPAFRLSFLLPYASVTAFPDNYLNLSDDTCLILMVAEYGHEVVHKVAWGNIGAVSIEFSDSHRAEAKELARRMVMGRL